VRGGSRGHEAALILGKVYRVLPDAPAGRDGLLRIVDESGEDYLFPMKHFALVTLPSRVRRQVLALQRTG
jgi:hypothetical protein